MSIWATMNSLLNCTDVIHQYWDTLLPIVAYMYLTTPSVAVLRLQLVTSWLHFFNSINIIAYSFNIFYYIIVCNFLYICLNSLWKRLYIALACNLFWWWIVYIDIFSICRPVSITLNNDLLITLCWYTFK